MPSQITSYNPFNTNSGDDGWVYYTYYDTGTFILDLINKSDIQNNTIYYFLMGQGGNGDSIGRVGAPPIPLQGELTGINFKFNITLGVINITIPTIKVSYTDINGNNAINNITSENGITINKFSDFTFPFTNVSNPLVLYPLTNVTFYDNLTNKILSNPTEPYRFNNTYGKFIGGFGGLGGGYYGYSIPEPTASGGGGGNFGDTGDSVASGALPSGNGINGNNGGIKPYGDGIIRGGNAGRGFNFLEGGISGGGGGGGNTNNGQNRGNGGIGGLGAVMIYYKKKRRFIYSFDNTNLPAFDVKYIPIINENNSFTELIVSSVVSGNTTTVTIYFDYSTIINNDGLNFLFIMNDYNYYKNNVNIQKFDGMPFNTTFGRHFSGLTNLIISATDSPTFLPNTYLNSTFAGCTNFNSNISNWNVSNVINMSSMFNWAVNFNQDISSWDVSNVTDMSLMFNGVKTFLMNAPTTSDVRMSFNQNLSNWNVSNVKNMSFMFASNPVFNQNISNWNVSNVLNMSNMFYKTSNFNQNISNWNVSNVTDMSNMFFLATSFNNLNNFMLWNCNSNVVALRFDTGSSLFYNRINFTYAIRDDATKTSIPNNIAVLTYAVRNDGITNIRELPARIFIYSFDNTNLSTFDSTKIPIINTSNSFTFLKITPSVSGNITTVAVNFTFTNINNYDGLSFQTNMVRNYYRSNTITIIQFENIPLSNNTSTDTSIFAFNPTIPYKIQGLTTVNVINNALDLPAILNSNSISNWIMYKEFTAQGQYNVNITSSFKRVEIYAIGAGGSGGAGGGDNKSGYRGTDGAGGGGGAYGYTTITTPPSIYSKLLINVGSGGSSVSGGNPASGDSNNGMPGNAGGNTYVNINNSTILIARGGTGGGGGHPSSGASPGIGGTTNIVTSQTSDISISGVNSNGIIGGISGYKKYYEIINKPFGDLIYGNGGNGTTGTYNPNTIPTGVGINGYVRIYLYN